MGSSCGLSQGARSPGEAGQQTPTTSWGVGDSSSQLQVSTPAPLISAQAGPVGSLDLLPCHPVASLGCLPTAPSGPATVPPRGSCP